MSHDPNHSPETPGNSPRPEHQPSDAAPGQDQHPHQSGPEEAAQQPQGQSQYDQNHYGQNQYAQNHYGQGQQPQGQYAQGQYAQGQQGQYAQGQYAQGQQGQYGQGQPGYGQPQYPQSQYGHPASSGGPQGSQPRKNNVVGIIALVVGIIGLVCACIPGIMILGWLLLPVAFILGIISLFLKGKKWPGIVGLVLSVLGSILGVVVFLVVMAHSVSDAADDMSGSSSSSSSASASETSGSGSSQTAHFGDTYRWDDGLEISVGKPQPFTPSDTAATGDSKGSQFRKFQVTVHNGTKEPVDAGSFTATTQSGGKQAEEVMDSEKGIGLASGKIQPGKDLNYTIVFGVADPSDISMDIDAYVGKDYSSHETTFQTN